MVQVKTVRESIEQTNMHDFSEGEEEDEED